MLLQRKGVEYVVSKSRLGDDSDDMIESEILSATPYVLYWQDSRARQQHHRLSGGWSRQVGYQHAR